ncbi:hypothetical protein EM4838_03170 [Enterococcus mundtii]|uniref:Phage protein n=1 Tax=Enterococcus mundtii TaxID=53346 RepID=A0ABQ0VGA2_ENTMU|nr:hypothetical protein [Enterococcus mundtii]AUB52037.1 hypothetical protein EM4838_03170 [Enterococcus mundtii]OJG57071.1 hypothetical protein RV08_GL002226 [Enterococcus mundtii]GEL81723.1 hypothetical protein EMU01_28670 [Enterococcus mundtii]GEN20578.1 hypothetical protein LAC02_38590 [Ligilactobacillus acidipiscis]
MSNKLSFQLEKKGFPVKIGELEFFFGTTTEELTRFFDVQSEFDERAKELKNQLKQIKNTDKPDKEDTLQILRISKELAKAEYDALLGEGSFEKIYSVYRDVEQLIDLFDPISFEVAEAIEKEAVKRKDSITKKKSELMKKRALKNKKKK